MKKNCLLINAAIICSRLIGKHTIFLTYMFIITKNNMSYKTQCTSYEIGTVPKCLSRM